MVLAYAIETPIETGELVALLTFTDDSVGEVNITTTERNDAHIEESVTVVLGSEAPPAPPEPSYEGPEWVWSDDYSMANAVFTPDDSSEELVLAAELSVETTGATCTEDGQTVYTAAVVFRDETYTDVKTVELPALGHDYDAESAIWTWDEENYSSASVTVTCSRCGDVMTLEAEITSLISEPDCLNPGTSAYIATASYEDQIFSDSRFFETEALGHDWDEGVETAAPGCTNAGLILYTCQRCGETRTEALDALGHDPQPVEAVEPTCTEPGSTAGSVCARCGAILEGVEPIPANGHSTVIDEAVAPSCTEPGLSAGAHCSVCGEVLAEQEPIEALGHEPESIPAVEPSCTEPGSTAGSVCARCGEVLEAPEEIEPLGHDYEATVTAPTCILPGFTTYVCARCGDSCVGDELPAQGHSYGEPSWTWSEDNSLALATFVCPVCGDAKICIAEISEEVSLEPAPHAPGEKKLTAAVVFNGETYTDGKSVELEALPCPCLHFEDMPEYGTPEHEAIDWAFTQGYTAGIDETHFGVGKSLTRAETATFLWTVSGKPEINEADFENPFSDIKPGKWYAKYVLWAYSEGLVSGYEDGSFRPNNELNRGEILTLLYAWADKPSIEGIENPYSDVAPGKWYEAPALWPYDKGIECGEDGLFARSTVVLRETFVLYLYRCMEGKCLDE